MTTRDELEAALAASWDRDTLAVYADHLQSIGDPRGELIALDLEIEQRGSSGALSARKTSLMYAWLGGLVPVDNVHHEWVGDWLRFGFVENLPIDSIDPNAQDRLSTFLRSPAAPYVKGVTIDGTTEEIERALFALSRTEHRWLTRLSIRLSRPLPVVLAAARDAIFAAAPRLECLELVGYPAFEPFSHPTLRVLKVTGIHVYTSLAGDDARFDAVTELDLDLVRREIDDAADWDYDVSEEFDVELPEPVEASARLVHVHLPALRRVDLSRNEPRGNSPTAFEFLRTLPGRERLTHLRLPSLRSDAEYAELVALVERMPDLVEVAIGRGHYFEPPPDLPHPTARFVRALAWPWPSPERARGRGLKVIQPGMKDGDIVSIASAVDVLEHHFENSLPIVRDAWTQFWQAVATLDADDMIEFPAAVLATALDRGPRIVDGSWREVHDELRGRRPLSPDMMLRIQRRWI